MNNIPQLSDATIQELDKFLIQEKIRVPLALYNWRPIVSTTSSLSTLAGKVDRLEELQKKYKEVGSNAKRDKIKAILFTALALALLAGIVLGAYYCWAHRSTAADIGGALLSILGGYVGMLLLGAKYNDYWADEGIPFIRFPGNSWGAGVFVWLLGPFIPLIQAFGREGRYEGWIKRLKEEVVKDKQALVEFFDTHRATLKQLVKALEGKEGSELPLKELKAHLAFYTKDII